LHGVETTRCSSAENCLGQHQWRKPFFVVPAHGLQDLVDGMMPASLSFVVFTRTMTRMLLSPLIH
jgi:hypothetical protein